MEPRTPHPERHPDDLPPPGTALPTPRRRVPRGIGWAAALAVVTVGVMGYVAATDDSRSGEGPTILDPHATAPPDEPADGAVAAGDVLPGDAFETFDGREASLTDYRGRPTVVNFWASWCPPCLIEMPAFEEVFREYDGAVAFVGLNIRDGEVPAERVIEQTGVTYDLGRDPHGDLFRSVGAYNMPTTVVADAEGRIVAVHNGEISADELRESLGTVPAR